MKDSSSTGHSNLQFGGSVKSRLRWTDEAIINTAFGFIEHKVEKTYGYKIDLLSYTERKMIQDAYNDATDKWMRGEIHQGCLDENLDRRIQFILREGYDPMYNNEIPKCSKENTDKLKRCHEFFTDQ